MGEKIRKINYIQKYGLINTTWWSFRKMYFLTSKCVEKYTGFDFINTQRKISNIIRPLFYPSTCSQKTKSYKGGLSFLDQKSFTCQFKKNMARHLYFDEIPEQNERCVDLNFAVYMQCYDQKKATFEALRSFRTYYDDINVFLLSDKGLDFSEIAEHFKCDYTYDHSNLAYRPCKDMMKWFQRLYDACLYYPDVEWILILEDDVRTRGKIYHTPQAHLAGQGGGNMLGRGKQLNYSLKKYLKELHPDLEINGISGCGGSIFHRKSFMNAFENTDREKWKIIEHHDPRTRGATDFALSALFLMHGYITRRWLDLSEEVTGNFGPGSAFDHQYKYFYGKELTASDILQLHKK